MKTSSKTLVMLILLLAMSFDGLSQGIHPYKMKFASMQSWPATSPKDINFKNFKPYRAVYKRTYTDASGNAVSDQVIMSAQRVAWYGKSVILFQYHDAANKDVKSTNARTQFYYLDEKTLEMYMAVGPKSGTPQDYTTVRVLDDKITTTRVNTTNGDAEFMSFDTSDPTFGFRQIRFLMWAAMDLKTGDQIKLQPLFNAPGGNQTFAVSTVEEQVDYDGPNNKKFRPFILDNTNNPTSAVVNKFYVVNEAPYLLAQGLYNADDKEIYRWWLKLESFEYLDD